MCGAMEVMTAPMQKALPGHSDIVHQLRGGIKVPKCRVNVDVPHVRGQSQHDLAAAIRADCLPDGCTRQSYR